MTTPGFEVEEVLRWTKRGCLLERNQSSEFSEGECEFCNFGWSPNWLRKEYPPTRWLPGFKVDEALFLEEAWISKLKLLAGTNQSPEFSATKNKSECEFCYFGWSPDWLRKEYLPTRWLPGFEEKAFWKELECQSWGCLLEVIRARSSQLATMFKWEWMPWKDESECEDQVILIDQLIAWDGMRVGSWRASGKAVATWTLTSSSVFWTFECHKCGKKS